MSNLQRIPRSGGGAGGGGTPSVEVVAWALGGATGAGTRLVRVDRHNGSIWMQRPDLPVPARVWSNAFYAGELLFCSGGYDGNTMNELEAWDGAVWVSKTGGGSVAWRQSGGVCNDKYYGGEGSRTGLRVRYWWEYDPSGDAWTRMADGVDIEGRASGAIANKVYCAGGWTGGVQVRTDEYDPAGDSWATKLDMPAPGRKYAGGVVLGSDLVSVGGLDSGSNYLVDNDIYTPSGNTWASDTDLPAPARADIGGGVGGGTALFFGGADGASSVVADTDVWDGSSWSTGDDLPVARQGAAGATVA